MSAPPSASTAAVGKNNALILTNTPLLLFTVIFVEFVNTTFSPSDSVHACVFGFLVTDGDFGLLLGTPVSGWWVGFECFVSVCETRRGEARLT